MWGVCWKSRQQVVPKFLQRETRGRVKITPREKGETRRDFHARARFALSTSREEKRELLVVYGKAVSSIGDDD